MPRRKLAKEIEIIEPGKILLLWQQLQRFIEQNIRQVAAVGLIIVVVAGGIGFWQYKKAQAEEESYALFFTAMNRYNSSDKPAGSKDAAPANDENFQQALQEFKKITAQYPDTTAGKTALFYAAACSYNLKKDQDALAYYQDFLKKTSGEQNYLRPSAYEGIGYVYERKGEYKQATEWFEKQKNDSSDSLNMLAPLNLARCYAALGDKEKACTSYKEFAEKYPSSSFAETAKIGVSEFCASTEHAAVEKPAK